MIGAEAEDPPPEGPVSAALFAHPEKASAKADAEKRQQSRRVEAQLSRIKNISSEVVSFES